MKVGSLVKCIAKIPCQFAYVGQFEVVQFPSFNTEYIVREIINDEGHAFLDDGPHLLLEEIRNKEIHCQNCGSKLEFPFPLGWFRELQSPDDLTEEMKDIIRSVGTVPAEHELLVV